MELVMNVKNVPIHILIVLNVMLAHVKLVMSTEISLTVLVLVDMLKSTEFVNHVTTIVKHVKILHRNV